jgi:hypothetical protein
MLRRLCDAIARFTRHRWNRWALLTVLAALAARPYLRNPTAFNDFRDAQVLWLYEDQARRSVVDFAQLPLWNPDFCGGLPALGTPQSRFASPTFLLTLLFGTTRAESLLVFAMVLVALLGAHRYARANGATHFAATLGASLFGLTGVFACAPFLGWYGFLGFALLPWVLHGVRRAAQGKAAGVVEVALTTAVIVGFGGTYVAPITLVAGAVEVALVLARRKRVDWKMLAAAGLLACGAAAFRLWPVWEELHRGSRNIAGISNVGWAIGGQLFGVWPPFTGECWYLVTVPGAVVAGLALLRRRARWLVAPLLLWLWLAMGHAATPSLFAALRALPIFSQLRNAERFLVPGVLVFSVGAAWALDDFRARLRRKSRIAQPGLLLALLGLSLAVPWQLQNFELAAGKRQLAEAPREVKRPFHQARGNRWSAAAFGAMSRGSLACWEAYDVPQSPKLRGDLEHEAWLEDAAAGTLEEAEWTPNRLDYRVTLWRPSRVLINQNYHRGWRSSAGEVQSAGGLLSVALPAGTHALRLRFLPTSAVGGLVVSALALGTLLVFRRRPRLMLAAAPLGVGVLFALTSPEPALSAVRSDDAVRLRTLPQRAKPLHVRFEGGVTLEGAQVTYAPEENRVRIELDWSRAEAVDQRLGVFVHVEPGTQKRLSADHLRLSDSVLLEELEVGEIGRDVVTFEVPQVDRGQLWNVWVGLWQMRGDGGRKAVLEHGDIQVSENRVLAGAVQVPP